VSNRRILCHFKHPLNVVVLRYRLVQHHFGAVRHGCERQHYEHEHYEDLSSGQNGRALCSRNACRACCACLTLIAGLATLPCLAGGAGLAGGASLAGQSCRAPDSDSPDFSCLSLVALLTSFTGQTCQPGLTVPSRFSPYPGGTGITVLTVVTLLPALAPAGSCHLVPAFGFWSSLE
jgi:hypothetical protein